MTLLLSTTVALVVRSSPPRSASPCRRRHVEDPSGSALRDRGQVSGVVRPRGLRRPRLLRTLDHHRLQEARGLRALFSLEIREMESSAKPRLSARIRASSGDAQCTADGADARPLASTVRCARPFRTAQAPRLSRSISPRSTRPFPRRRSRGRRGRSSRSIFLTRGRPHPHGRRERVGELKAIPTLQGLDPRATRDAPGGRDEPFRGASAGLHLRVAHGRAVRANRWPPAR